MMSVVRERQRNEEQDRCGYQCKGTEIKPCHLTQRIPGRRQDRPPQPGADRIPQFETRRPW